jgi:hypothetical protein
VAGTHRLLVLDGHGSHATPEFDAYCTENNIITLCLPAHTSHITQPLDVACFSPLKTAYSQHILDLARKGIFHVDKTDFLIMYHRARCKVFTEVNIQSGFRATGLVPYNPGRVLDTLPVYTPSPPGTPQGQTSVQAWASTTPSNLIELESQVKITQEAIQRLSQSPSEPLSKVAKCAQQAFSIVILQNQRIKELEAGIKALQEKKRRKRRHVQKGGTLCIQEGLDIIQSRDLAGQEAQGEKESQPRQRALPTCSNCHVQGHKRNCCPEPLVCT